jgi:imidazolonepropionase-like amidohydrolase
MNSSRKLPGLAAAAILALAQGAIAQDATLINARIVVGNGEVIANGSIVMQSGRIVAVTAGRPATPIGKVIDAKGMTAMAGFIDAHRHLQLRPDSSKAEMQALLDAGFTTILSAGGPPERALAIRQQIDAGQINGPRIIAAGPTMALAARTPEAGREEIRKLAALGVRYTGELLLSPVPGPSKKELETLAAMLDEGAKAGVNVQVHAVSTSAMVAAVETGVQLLVHMPNKDWVSREQAQLLARSNTKILMAIGFGSPVFGVFANDNKPRFRDGKPWPEGIIDGVGGGKEAGYSMVNSRTQFDAGVLVGNGMDTTYDPRMGLSQELRSMNVVFSPTDMVKIMGPNTAAYLGMQDQIGALEAGKLADIVLLDGDPLDGYWNWLRVRMVIKDGKVVVDARR